MGAHRGASIACCLSQRAGNTGETWQRCERDAVSQKHHTWPELRVGLPAFAGLFHRSVIAITCFSPVQSLLLLAAMSKVKSFVTATTIAVAASLAGGCVLHGSGEVSTGVHVAPADHRVVQVSPGVWVVEDYHTPVFFSDGYYWERRSGYWYRSSYYNGGFVRVGFNVVPHRIRSVRRPRSYVRYRAPRGARYRSVRGYNRGNRGYRRNNVRDRRYNNRDRRYNNRSRARDRRYDNRSRTRDRRYDNRSRTRDRRHNTRSRTRDRRHDNRSRRGKTRDKRKRSRSRDKRRH